MSSESKASGIEKVPISVLPDTQARDGGHRFLDSLDKTSKWRKSRGHHLHQREAIVFYSAIGLCIAVILIAVAVWLGLTMHHWHHKGWSAVHGMSIGGRLTQSQAKAIDLLCSALIAPLILAGFCSIWFSCARVVAVSEHPKNTSGISLAALVEACQTDSGSYSIPKMKVLLSSRAGRLKFLAMLVLCAAIANSALGNVIAYEAFPQRAMRQSPMLRQLNDVTVPSSWPPPGGHLVAPQFSGTYDYNSRQLASFANQFTGMMTGISFQNASLDLDNGAYTLINATSASLTALPQSVIELHDVPGYSWSINCSAYRPSMFFVTQQGETEVVLTILGSQPEIQGYYPGDIATLQNAYNERYSFLAFDEYASTAFLGYLNSFNLSTERWETDFGPITPAAFNMTASGFTGTKETMSVWGIRCNIFEQEGALRLARLQDGSWGVQSAEWSGQMQQVNFLRLQQFQLNLNYNAPEVILPGLGSPLAASASACSMADVESGTCEITNESIDYQTLALNFLYASGETERLAYEVAATNTSRNRPDFFYNVTAVETVEYYRMTYVPVILLIGLLSLFGASIITTGMIMYAWASFSTRTFRQIDVTRLVVDGVVGLKDEQDVLDAARSSTKWRLEDWAQTYRVKYIGSGGGGGGGGGDFSSSSEENDDGTGTGTGTGTGGFKVKLIHVE